MDIDIVSEILQARRKMYALESLAEQATEAKAQTTSEYYKVLGETIKDYRDQGYGVNLCESIAKGDSVVSECHREMLKAESIYYTRMDSLRTIRADLDILKTLLISQKELSKEG